MLWCWAMFFCSILLCLFVLGNIDIATEYISRPTHHLSCAVLLSCGYCWLCIVFFMRLILSLSTYAADYVSNGFVLSASRLCSIRFDMDKYPSFQFWVLFVIIPFHFYCTNKEESGVWEWIEEKFVEFVNWAAMSLYTGFLFSIISFLQQKWHAAPTPAEEHRDDDITGGNLTDRNGDATKIS